MRSVARLSIVALVVTYLHLVFGGIVRITGSGMGCGDHWPKCNGSWIPPFSDFTVMIEWTHRLLALLVIVSIVAMTIAARRARGADPSAAPAARSATWALVSVITVALLGMVTVRLGNTTLATVAHWTLAMAVIALVATTAIRAGALGGARAVAEGGTPRSWRSLLAGAVIAFLAVVMGGIVAKYPGAGVACPGFPLCGDTPAGVPAGAGHVQLTHRVLAYFLFFHVLGVGSAISRRAGESQAVRNATRVAMVLVVGQLVLGAAMVLNALPPVLRSLHQALGIAIWLAMFVGAYLARIAFRSREVIA